MENTVLWYGRVNEFISPPGISSKVCNFFVFYGGWIPRPPFPFTRFRKENQKISDRKLRHIQLIINALLCHQFLHISFLDDSAIVNYENAVGFLDRG